MRYCIISWFVFVTAISLAPLRAKRLMHTIGPWHDCGHLLVFFTTGALVLFGAPGVSSRAFRTAAILLFCAAIELIQAVTGRNRFEWRDVQTDAFGLFSAWAAIIVFQTLIETHRTQAPKPQLARYQFPDPQLPRATNSIEG